MLKNQISIIVSIYNVQEYLHRAVDSLLAQTIKELEIILVDDGSTDESGRICDAYGLKDERIKVIHQTNKGLSGARNSGIEAACGEYIGFLDGDDWVDPQMYEKMLEAMKACNASLAICSYKEIREEGIIDPSGGKVTVFEGREALEVFIQEDERYRIQNAAWNKLYTRDLLGSLRFPQGRLFEDIVYTTRLIAAAERTVYIDQAYYNYVVDRSGSIMNSQKGEKILSHQVVAYQEKGAFLKEIGELELYRTHQYFFLKRMLLHYLQAAEEKMEGYKLFLKCMDEVIRKEADWSVYKGKDSRRGEYLRLRLFYLSPLLYLGFVRFSQRLLIPMKQRRRMKHKKQIIIVLSGGLGNQMFQYALYLYFLDQGIPVKIDDITEYRQEKKRRPELEVFGLHYERATAEEICHWTDSYLDIFSRIRRKIFGRKSRQYTDTYDFQPEVLRMQDGYLYGWWQSEKYFEKVKDQVREAFRLSPDRIDEKTKRMAQDIRKIESVGVHVRRGDYLQVNELYGGICTREYYQRAMDKMRREFPGCGFFLFTNDPGWVQEHMQAEDVWIVEGNDEAHGYLDLYLMSCCRHNIIANSTFSWWAAWLNDNPKKKIIAPKSWVNGRKMEDIYTQDMDTCI